MEDSQLAIMKGIRKPIPPPSKVIMNDKDVNKQKRWNWQDELANIGEGEDDFSDFSDLDNPDKV